MLREHQVSFNNLPTMNSCSNQDFVTGGVDSITYRYNVYFVGF